VVTQGASARAKVIDLAFVSDRAYLPWVATAIRSAADHHSAGTLRVHLVDDGSLQGDDEARMADLAASSGVNLVRHVVDPERLSGLPVTAQFGSIVWCRFLLPELLSELERVLYLDADTLVLDSLSPLWEASIGSHPLAAVGNIVEPTARGHIEVLGLDRLGGVFNSGVLLMDLEAVRNDLQPENVMRVLSSCRDIQWPDQDALNLIFRDRWFRLHPRWNAQNSFWSLQQWAPEVFETPELEQARQNPGIRHFEGPTINKPWHYLATDPYRKKYRATLARTPWLAAPLAGRTPIGRLMRPLPPRIRFRVYAAYAKRRGFF
jgi:lipopolysaccharide biosynthesis glycosyltransferase